MLFQSFSPALPAAALALTLALGGCVAVPLAQMAVTQMAPKPCLSVTGCQPAAAGGGFEEMSTGISGSLRRLTSLAVDSQPVAPAAPVIPAK
jgi:hypothetical protein